jgi:SWI/SNF-related matrix-associated actin-dependent regulator 1 of chromatin subfamily A
MQLDYNPNKGLFFLRVPRVEMDPDLLRRQQGLDFSIAASTPEEAVLFTREPYAAVPFFEHATERARVQLLGLQNEINSSWAVASNAHIKCPADQELSPFQKAGVEYALRRTNTLIGDQPGLGKTMQAICYCNEVDAKRVLVICPANIRLQWSKKIREWTTMSWPYYIYPIMHGRAGVNPMAHWTIVSYDLARTEPIWKALSKQHFDVVIIDEGHYLKTIDSKRTRAIFGGGDNPIAPPIMDSCDSILALSGTPLPNRPREAYTLARGLNFDSIDWMSEEKFTDRFNPSFEGQTEDGKKYKEERTGRHGELQARLRANFMVRRMKRLVMPQLKLPVLDIVHVEETGPVKQALKAESLLDIDPSSLEGADAETLGHVAVVRRLMGVAVAPQAADYTALVLDGGEDKVVVFAWHIEVLNILQERLDRYGVVRVDGSTSAHQKEVKKNAFIERPDIRVFLGNMQSIGTGTDGLQAVCSHAIFAEPDWVPGTNEQCVDRLDRGGQTREVQADFLVAPGSFGERILASAIIKKQTTNEALDRRFA